MQQTIARKIATRVQEVGGRTFYVGGFVRDKLRAAGDSVSAYAGGVSAIGRAQAAGGVSAIGRAQAAGGVSAIENAPADIDLEVHGISPETLYAILAEIAPPLSIGSSFGIYTLPGSGIDVAMPRKEKARGAGHRDFEVFVDPYIGPREAAKRRDFTVNAIMEDVLTGEIIDPFGGCADLSRHILRHVSSETFPEDPLRVLRAAQFRARFHFTIAPETVDLCRGIDLSLLSRERVEGELKKALLSAPDPALFFETLREMGQLHGSFSELEALIGVEQDAIYHPEGDVWTHTMETLSRASAYRNDVSAPYPFLLLALTHDFGKVITTERVNGRIHAYEHETKGLPLIESFLARLTNEKDVVRYVLNMVPLHMRPNMLAYAKSPVKKTNALFDAATSPNDLIYFAMADRPLFAGEDAFTGDFDFLFERLRIYREMMARPYVTGADLIRAGLSPDERFSDLLSYAHKLRLAGIEKETALKQVLARARG